MPANRNEIRGHVRSRKRHSSDVSGVLYEQKFGGFRGNLSHLGDETAVAPIIAVIVDPFLVERRPILGGRPRTARRLGS